MAKPQNIAAPVSTAPAAVGSILRAAPVMVTGAPGWLTDAVMLSLGGVLPRGHSIRAMVQKGMTPERLMAWRAKRVEVSDTVAADLADAESLKDVCKGLAGGVLLHSAGIIHPRRTSDWYRVNRDGTLALAKSAVEAGMRRFIYVSSNAAQGHSGSTSMAMTEDMPCRPTSHYGMSKRQTEEALLKMHQPGKFEVVIVRPCMLYGPWMPQRHIDILNKIRNGRLPLVGGGRYARSLSYVEDLVQGVLLVMEHPAAAGEVFNLCDTQVYTTRDICEAMAGALGVPARFWPLPGFSSTIAYGVDRTLAAAGIYSMNFHLLGEANWNVGCSNEKARRLLGWNPQVDAREGYRRAVAWAREQKLL
jgi:nucleoside-diphosphate-sugar epimerase